MARDPDTRRRRVIWWLKLAAALAAVAIAFRGVSPADLGRAIAASDPGWLAAAVASVFVTVSLIAARWRTLLPPVAATRGGRVLFAAVITSQVANIALPYRLGDAVRIGAVSRALALPPSTVFASVAVERLLDAGAIAVTAACLAATGALPAFARAGLLSLAAGLALALAALLLVLAAPAPFARALAVPGRRLPARLRDWIVRQGWQLSQGLAALASPGRASVAVMGTAAVTLSSIGTAWLVMRAVDPGSPAISAAVVVIAVQIGGVALPVPGGLGVSQVITVETLRLWNVGEAPALAYALLLYLVSRGPKLAVLPMALTVLTPRTPPDA